MVPMSSFKWIYCVMIPRQLDNSFAVRKYIFFMYINKIALQKKIL